MTPATTDTGPRLASEVRRQLEEWSDIRRDFEANGDMGYAGLKHLEQMKLHEAELREELRAAELVEHDATADFVLDGAPIRGHEVPAKLLGTFLERIQALNYAVGQVMTGKSTSRSRIPKHVADAYRLYVQPDFILGSFGFRVRVPSGADLEELIENEAENSLKTVCLLLGDDDPSEDGIELLSHSRVKSHYSALMEMMAKENVGLTMRHRAYRDTIRLAASQARERTEWLSQLQISEETIVRTGELVGGSIEQSRFELRSDDDLIKGKLSAQARQDIKLFHWGDSVSVTLRVTQSEHEESISGPSEAYWAVRIEPRAEPQNGDV